MSKESFEQYMKDYNSDNYIPLKNCHHGFLYKIHSRNLSYGVFNIKDSGFIGIRTKFGNVFLFTEYHWDTGAPDGTVKPLKEVCKVPDNIIIDERLSHVLGDLYAKNPKTNKEEEVVRRNLNEYEVNHGKRQGFVDEWVDSGERLPDNLYPHTKSNKELFKFLNKYEND